MAARARLLSELVGLRNDYVKRMNALWLLTVEDIAGIIRLSEINPGISSQMISSLFAYELDVTQETAKNEFMKIIRDSIPNHEWYAIAKIEDSLPFGWLLDDLPKQSNQEIFLASSPTTALEPLPARINLLETFPEFFPNVRNQDQRGTCVAFAVTALNEYIWGRLHHEMPPRLSEEFLYWASRNMQYRDMPTTCHQCGTIIYSALEAIIEFGQCTHETLPYRNRHRPCNIKLFDGDLEDKFNLCQHDNPEQKGSFIASGEIPQGVMSEAEKYRLSNWEIVGLATIKDIKRALQEGYPVLIGVKAYLSWYSPSSRHKGRINIPFQLERTNSEFQVGGHVMLLVGYEENPQDISLMPPGGGYFLVRNSWGKSWGDESTENILPGYGMLPYDYLSQGSFQAYTLKPKNNQDVEFSVKY